MVKLGIGTEYDTIVFGQRMALFTDEKAGQEYVDNITLAIKVTPNSQTKLDLFPAPELRVKGTGKTEIDLKPALEDLRKAILVKHSNLAAKELETDIIQYISDANGKTTGVIIPIELWQEIAGERETAYLLSSERMKARLLEAKERHTGIHVEMIRKKLGI